MGEPIHESSGSPLPRGKRASGLLLHVTALPSAYGIGDLGPSAFTWLDRLHEAGQSWWQALPLGPTGYNNSPYQCLSSFVGQRTADKSRIFDPRRAASPRTTADVHSLRCPSTTIP